MFRLLGAGILALALAGCATSDGPPWWRTLAGLPPVPGHFRFDWQMDGDSSLAPLQVFDDGRRTWLQYPAGQPVPAVFERTASGDRLLHPGREGDYLVISGVPSRLLVRGGSLQAQIWRDSGTDSSGRGAAPASPPVGSPANLSAATPAAESVPVILSSAVSAGNPAAPARTFVPAPPPVVPLLPVPQLPSLPAPPHPSSGALASSVPAPGSAGASSARRPSVQPASAATRPRPPGSFEASPADGNIRRALGRWAQSAGWLFEAEHWAVDVDIPLAGSAAFGDEFVPAVRGLLAATELGERPLQPCFYVNRVLRVVPLAQRCDRTQVPGVSS